MTVKKWSFRPIPRQTQVSLTIWRPYRVNLLLFSPESIRQSPKRTRAWSLHSNLCPNPNKANPVKAKRIWTNIAPTRRAGKHLLFRRNSCNYLPPFHLTLLDPKLPRHSQLAREDQKQLQPGTTFHIGLVWTSPAPFRWPRSAIIAFGGVSSWSTGEVHRAGLNAISKRAHFKPGWSTREDLPGVVALLLSLL